MFFTEMEFSVMSRILAAAMHIPQMNTAIIMNAIRLAFMNAKAPFLAFSRLSCVFITLSERIFFVWKSMC